jgi:hypothetical protein
MPMWHTRDVGTNPNNNGNCGRQILITNVAGQPVHRYVTVIDRCKLARSQMPLHYALSLITDGPVL